MLATDLHNLEACSLGELRALLGAVHLETVGAERASDYAGAARFFAQHLALLRVARRRFPDLYEDPTVWPSP
jgi:hypothetical protein